MEILNTIGNDLKVEIISGTDDEVFETRVNEALAKLKEDKSIIEDIEFSNSQSRISVMIVYNIISNSFL